MKIGNEENLLPTINFLQLKKSEPPEQWGPYRTINDFQLIYIVLGSVEFKIGKETYLAYPGDGVYFGPDELHQITTKTSSSFYSVHFNWIGDLSEQMHNVYPVRGVKTGSLPNRYPQHELEILNYGIARFPRHFTLHSLEPLFQQLAKEYWDELPLYSTTMRTLMLTILMKIIRAKLLSIHNAVPNIIGPALQAILNEPEKNWSVKELADLCGYHPKHFSRVFKNKMGKNPKEYLIEKRIKVAQSFLLDGMNIEEIAHRLDYNSFHYFSKKFKKVTGLTPTEFRQQKNMIL